MWVWQHGMTDVFQLQYGSGLGVPTNQHESDIRTGLLQNDNIAMND